jgi:hypothetical protein
MVGNKRTEGCAWDAPELIANLVHLVLRDAPIAQSGRSRGVDAEYGKLGIGEEWKLMGRDVAMETIERPESPPQKVVERHVVIAGHRNDRRREPVEKFACGGEFGAARPLRKVAADGDEIGFLAGEIGEKPFRDDRVVAAEMQIGNMGDRPHHGLGHGKKKRRSRGRMR